MSQKAKNKDKDSDKDSDEPAAKKTKSALPAWRFVEPKDLKTALVDDNDKKWTFCTKCVCRQSGKKGLYRLSHFDHKHKDDYTPPAPLNESNLASIDVPMGIAAATFRDDDVSGADARNSDDNTVTHVDPSLADDLDDDASFAEDLASLAHLSFVEREMFLQVEHDLFPGSSATQVMWASKMQTQVAIESTVEREIWSHIPTALNDPPELGRPS